MSDLTITEKLKLEKLLQMDSGYVLDFSNKDFREFIHEELSIDICCEKYNYDGCSKAKLLRAFWKKEPNFMVAKLIEKLLEYWNTKKLISQRFITTEDEKLFSECQKIRERLQGGKAKNIDEKPIEKERLYTLQHNLLLEFDSFAALKTVEEKRKRGFLLEDLLERIFSLYEIPTQKSFRRNGGGEQIDGAFKLESWFYI